MDESVARKLIEEKAPHLRRALGLWNWSITYAFGPIENEGQYEDWVVKGMCDAHFKYRQAMISLDHNVIDTEEKFLDILRHEMLHIFHAAQETACETVAAAISPNDRAMIVPSMTLANESIVLQIETMFDTLDLTPTKLIEQAKADFAKVYEEPQKKEDNEPLTHVFSPPVTCPRCASKRAPALEARYVYACGLVYTPGDAGGWTVMRNCEAKL